MATQYNLVSLKSLGPLTHCLILSMFSALPHSSLHRNCRESNSKDQAGLAYLSTSPAHLMSAPATWSKLLLPPLKAMFVCDSAAVINGGLLNFLLGWSELTCTNPRHVWVWWLCPYSQTPSAPQVWLGSSSAHQSLLLAPPLDIG